MSTDASASSLLLYYDPDKGTVLDRWTRKAYRSMGDQVEESNDYLQGGFWNTAAGGWAQSLELSDLFEGEELPPEGSVGQYGRYGCVMVETSEGLWDSAEDVCLFPYDLGNLPQLLKELKQASGARFRELDIDVASVSGMHGLSIRGHWFPAEELDDDAECAFNLRKVYEDEASKTHVGAALAWGREHAERMASS